MGRRRTAIRGLALIAFFLIGPGWSSGMELGPALTAVVIF